VEPKKDTPTSFLIQGKVVSGLGEGKLFTELPWAKEQFINKLGINPYPGTLNLKLENPQIIDTLRQIKNLPGIYITPDNPEFCQGLCYKVIIQEEIPGAIVIPLVPGYPPDKLEIISPYNLKEILGLSDGDTLAIRVIVSETPPE